MDLVLLKKMEMKTLEALEEMNKIMMKMKTPEITEENNLMKTLETTEVNNPMKTLETTEENNLMKTLEMIMETKLLLTLLNLSIGADSVLPSAEHLPVMMLLMELPT